MNIKFTHTMLRTFLDTDATPDEIREYVSLGGPNVETVEKIDGEYVYDIEVTSNRIDAASAFGFALECAAILPRYNRKAILIENPLTQWNLSYIKKPADNTPIHIAIQQDDVAQRIMALVLSNISVSSKSTPIGTQIEYCGERSVNNIVDISNYIRIMLGHPVHIFDYDKIANHTMTIRLSKKGETIETLDGKTFSLPGDDIVIEDGEGKLIDLAGIMGAKNTEVSEETKNIVLFVPTFTGTYIRKTSMNTAQRTNAVAYFEKNVDPNRASSVLVYGTTLFKDLGAIEQSEVIDIYTKPVEDKKVSASLKYINTLISTQFSGKEVAELISQLGFANTKSEGDTLEFSVPSYRALDIADQADIAEEVARIYGYHNIKGRVEVGTAVRNQEEGVSKVMSQIQTQEKIQMYLSSLGFNEQYNYSMISKKMVEDSKLQINDHLHLANTISEEIEYMRTSLAPSLIKNVSENLERMQECSFFEIARVYVKRDGDLPVEKPMLAIATTKNYFYLKGVVEHILELLRVPDVDFTPSYQRPFLTRGVQAGILSKNAIIGYIGSISASVQHSFGLPNDLNIVELDIEMLLTHRKKQQPYKTPHSFARIKRDITYTSSRQAVFSDIQSAAYKASDNLLSLYVTSIYENKITLRFEFGFADKNMTEEEAQIELNKIITSVQALQ